jgi:predicted phosphodiesterase
VRYALISDIHGNVQALDAVLGAVDSLEVDDIVCLGDVVGYNADPEECVKRIRERGIPTILGNHDSVAAGLEEPLGFNPAARKAALWTRDHLSAESLAWLRCLPESFTFSHFMAVHSAPCDPFWTYLIEWEDVVSHLSYLTDLSVGLCFFGHTHSPGIFSTEGSQALAAGVPISVNSGLTYLINPGSVGQPRDKDPRASFGVLDTDKHEFLLHRAPYPVRETAEHIVSVGLPGILADRLFKGR